MEKDEYEKLVSEWTSFKETGSPVMGRYKYRRNGYLSDPTEDEREFVMPLSDLVYIF